MIAVVLTSTCMHTSTFVCTTGSRDKGLKGEIDRDAFQISIYGKSIKANQEICLTKHVNHTPAVCRVPG